MTGLDFLEMGSGHENSMEIKIVKHIYFGNFSIFLIWIGIFDFFSAGDRDQYPLSGPPFSFNIYSLLQNDIHEKIKDVQQEVTTFSQEQVSIYQGGPWPKFG